MGKNNPKFGRSITAALFAAGLLILLQAADSAALDNPHISNNAVNCGNCHTSAGGGMDFANQGDQATGVCGQCHNPTLIATDVKTHMSPKYGATVQCTECHNPHYQRQSRVYKDTPLPSSYLATGTIAAVTPTQVTLSQALPDPATEGLSSWVGTSILPDKRYTTFIYTIAAYDGNVTITIDTGKNGQEAINTTYIRPGATFAITYGRLLKEAVGGRTVRYFRPEGQNSFADSDGVIDGVCQVCHYQTHSFKSDGTLEGGPHPKGEAGFNCLKCHSHIASDGAFVPECDKCHGNPPTRAGLPYGGPDGLASYNPPTNDVGTGSATQGKHQKHAGTGAGELGYGCANCHSGYAMPESVSKTVDLGFDRNGKTGGNYKGQTGVSYRGNAGTIVNTGSSPYECSNIYCHSNAKGGTPVESFSTVEWNPAAAAMTCGSCHAGTVTGPDYANGGAGAATANSHDKHVVVNGFTCDKCHNDTTDNGTTIRTDVTPSKHVDGNAQDIVFDSQNPDGYYIGGSKTCSNLSCHNNGNTNRGATPGSSDAQWGATLTCDGCHGDQAGKAHPVYASGGQASPTANTHIQHVEGSGLSCDYCHETTTTDTTIPPTSTVPAGTHLNGSETVSFKSVGGRTGNYTDASATCDTTYCHGSGTPIWGESSYACDACHSANNALLGRHGTHYATTNLVSDRTAANYSTGNTYIFKCGVCHDGTTHAGGPVDGNQAGQVAFNSTYAGATTSYAQGSPQVADRGFNWTSGTCSTYCHSQGRTTTAPYGGPPNDAFNWATPSGTFTCGSCHNNVTGQPSPMSSVGHNVHVSWGATCNACHVSTTSDGTSITGADLHVNMVKNVTINATYDTNGDPADNYSAPTCSNVRCHSDGKTTYASPQWNVPNGVGCSFCHAFPPNTAAHATHIQNASLLTQVYGSTEAASDGTNYAFGCGHCHPTVLANHINGIVEIDVAPVADGSLKSKNSSSANKAGSGTSTVCNLTYCHSDGTKTGDLIVAGASPQWGETFASMGGDACAKCHLNSPGTNAHSAHSAGIHYDDIYNNATGKTAATGGAGSGAGHGDPAVSTTISCNICHSGTVAVAYNDQNTDCIGCHTGGAAKGSLARANLTKSSHVNGTVDVVFADVQLRSRAQVRDTITTVTELRNNWTRSGGYKAAASHDITTQTLQAGGTWTGVSKTCSIACHNGNPVVWTSSISCDSCHTSLP